MIDFKLLKKAGKDLSVADFHHVYHGSELILAQSLIEQISRQYDLNEYFKGSPDLLAFAQKLRAYFQTHEISSDLIKFEDLDNLEHGDERLGEFLQTTLSHEDRKTLASNYTRDSMDFLRVFIDQDNITSVCDHFVGSGNLIVSCLRVLHEKGQNYPQMLRINDLMPVAVLIAFWRIKSLLPTQEIEATIGDGFAVEGRFDLVLINPPYTRASRIELSLREELKQRLPSGKSLGHAGLHFWAVMSIDSILSSEGTAIMVLPRAVLNAQYTGVMKEFLLETFSSIKFVQSQSMKAFSKGSELRELLLIAASSSKKIEFIEFSPPKQKVINTLSVEQLSSEWNWGRFFLPASSLELSTIIKGTFIVDTRKGIGLEIKRGIEMYGPDLFFFPNRRFTLKHNAQTISIEELGSDLNWEISKSLFKPILRKPNLYKTSISPNVEQYVLATNILEGQVKDFFLHIEEKAQVAKRKFGARWQHHPFDQLNTKGLGGHIFIIDKLDIYHTPTLAYYSKEKLLCTKNFYELSSSSEEYDKLIGAWLNSSWYLLLYLTHRREIGGSYGRLQIIDYSYHHLILTWQDSWKKSEIDEVFKIFDKLRLIDLPALPDQIKLGLKRELDEAFAKLCGVDIEIQRLYEQIQLLSSEMNLVSQ